MGHEQARRSSATESQRPMTRAKHFVVLFASFSITTIGVVAAQESPAKTASKVVRGAREIHVSTQGNDKNDGSTTKPVASLQIAQLLARTARGTTVVIHGGTYRLERRLEFTPADEGIEFRAAAGEKVVVTSDRKLELKWQPFRDGMKNPSHGSAPKTSGSRPPRSSRFPAWLVRSRQPRPNQAWSGSQSQEPVLRISSRNFL